MFLDKIESASEKELQALQLERLKGTIHHAYHNNPFWKKHFDQHKVGPDTIKSLSDLAKFPFLVKEDLRKQYPFGMFCVPQKEISRIHASSGTTGSPTVVGYTKHDIDDWANVVARSIFTAGGRPGDIVQVSYGYGLFTGGLGAHYGAERLGCVVVPHSVGQTERQIKLLKDFQSKIIMVTPSYLLTIADAMDSCGVRKEELGLRIGILGAEPWTFAMREEIERRIGIDALDIYGLSEVIGPGVGQESSLHKGTTILWEDYFYPEIIDPDGNVLPMGESGELVFTSLRKQAMPIIRYRTRDITKLNPPSHGRCMRSMDRIVGRNDDMMIIRGVNVFPSQLEEQIITCNGLRANYQIQLYKKDRLDMLLLQVESEHAGVDINTIKNELVKKIKTFVGIQVEVSIVPKDSLPKSEGKAKRVTDKRGE
ncbi:MAG: phenylacetate--CoA ligase [Methylacidiphilales bacterium]|nr:phenylacetate--CoA ligase [Candidatus Methylacidiphilales bacterium]